VRRRNVILIVAVLLVFPSPARAQAVISAGDDVKLRFGVLGQFWADAINDPFTDTETRNLFVRRVRLITSGEVVKRVSFFIETDAPNLGRTVNGKNITPSMIVQDAFVSFSVDKAFTLDAGLMFVPFSRNSIQSAASLLPIDYGAYTFAQSAATQSSTGRDTGFQARGYLVHDHVEYRLGAFQGARDAGSHNDFRYAGRIQVDLLDPEVGFFYTGTNLGKKRIASVAAAFDKQENYHAFDVDGFVDLPVWTGALTAQLDYNRLDGGTFFAALPTQNTYLAEVGFLLTPARLTPFIQWTDRDLIAGTFGDENRTSVGAAFWWAAHNANIKAAYTRIAPSLSSRQHEFTLQLQLYYF
jgi:Phosphate-selective porin O and P